MIIHGVPLSQPWRSVVWPCLIKRLPIKVELAVPGMAKGRGTGSPKFLAKFPRGTVPALEDGDLCLAEAPAILTYMCRKHKWDDFYPEELQVRAKIDEYLHWHHSNTRAIAGPYFAAAVRPDIVQSPEMIAMGRKKAEVALQAIEDSFLGSSSKFMLGASTPTIADFMAYPEIAQIGPSFGDTADLTPFPHILAWLEAMRQVPCHDEVHTALATLGKLDLENPKNTIKLLGPATKAGMEAVAKAQE